MEEILRMEHITKRFGDMYANRDISFDVRKGEVHTLLGENGAGKSTLMNVLFGLYQPTEGSIYIHGKKVRIDSPAQAVKQGIGMVHQHFMLVEAMTVLENIILGDRNTKGIFIDKDARRREIQKLADQYGLEVELDKPITEIAVGAQQRVEILKALYRGAELLVLDEPTSGLDPVVRDDILDLLWDFVQDEQNAVLISSHITSDLEKVADYIVFLNQGRVVFEKPKDELRYRWGMLRCGAERFRTLDPADLVAWRQQDYEYEALVYDREAAHKKYPDALIDPATIDEIMLMHIRGEKP